MTPQQALQLIDTIGSKYVGTREDHIQIQMAVSVLGNLVNNAEAKTPKGKAEASTPENESPASDGKEQTADKKPRKAK